MPSDRPRVRLGPFQRRALTGAVGKTAIGRSNAYLSQIERGLIKQPDPIVLLELSELYGLNFSTLAAWALWLGDEPDTSDAHTADSTTVLVRQVMQLDATQRTTVLRYVDSILREHRT